MTNDKIDNMEPDKKDEFAQFNMFIPKQCDVCETPFPECGEIFLFRNGWWCHGCLQAEGERERDEKAAGENK